MAEQQHKFIYPSAPSSSPLDINLATSTNDSECFEFPNKYVVPDNIDDELFDKLIEQNKELCMIIDKLRRQGTQLSCVTSSSVPKTEKLIEPPTLSTTVTLLPPKDSPKVQQQQYEEITIGEAIAAASLSISPTQPSRRANSGSLPPERKPETSPLFIRLANGQVYVPSNSEAIPVGIISKRPLRRLRIVDEAIVEEYAMVKFWRSAPIKKKKPNTKCVTSNIGEIKYFLSKGKSLRDIIGKSKKISSTNGQTQKTFIDAYKEFVKRYKV